MRSVLPPTCRRRSATASLQHRRRVAMWMLLCQAPVKFENEYRVAVEHHNPMEPHATTVIWEDGGKLVVYDKTQGVQNSQNYVTGVFGLKKDDVRVISPFVGGAFGSGLRPQYQLSWR